MKREISNLYVKRLFIFIVLLAAMSVGAGQSPGQIVYDDALDSSWENFSWSSNVTFDNQSPALGTRSIAVETTESYGAFYVFNEDSIDVSNSDEIKLQIRGSVADQKVLVFAVDSNGDFNFAGEIAISDDSWKEVILHVDELDGLDRIAGIAVQEGSGDAGGGPVFFIDEIEIGDFVAEPVREARPGPAITVDVNDEQGAISDGIYGLNFADDTFAAEIGLAVNRWGGNSTTRYNYQIDTTNLASDFYYENMHQAIGQSSDEFIAKNVATETDSMITIGMLGYVAKSQELIGSFSVTKYGAQTDVNMYRPDHGNGILLNGTRIENDPLDTGLPVDENFAKAWVQEMVSNFGSADNGGVRYYMLDNEPMLWNSTHIDAHPQPAGYDDVFELGARYAKAIKEIDPTAEVMGPAVFGWTAYFYSALDAAPGGDWFFNPLDQNAHGGQPFLKWYLEQMADYEANNGVRLLDYLDIHYYPQHEGVSLEPAGDLQLQAKRLESTRSLWDPAYIDDSWINETVRLVPRMKEWIQDHYPGTKLAINEYNFGGLEHINGAITQADVLGIFGREGVDIACLWASPESNLPGAFAFRMYRNYDGSASPGGRFGETVLNASSADSNLVSVFAASRNSDGSDTVMLINKTADPLITPLTLANLNEAVAEVYCYDDRNLQKIVRFGDIPILGGAASITLPPNSITLLEISEVSTVPTRPTVLEIEIDDASGQRSRIRTLDVRFDSLVSFANGDPTFSFTLAHVDEGAVSLVVDQVDESEGVTKVSLSFEGPLTRAGNALVDGDYIFSINGLGYFNQSNRMSGMDFQTSQDPGSILHSLFGDTNGNQSVDIFDLLGFRKTFLLTNADPRFAEEYDFDDNMIIDIFDLLEFRKRFGLATSQRSLSTASRKSVR